VPELHARDDGDVLELRIRWWHPRRWWTWSSWLFFVAAALGLVFFARYVLATESWGLLVPLGLFGVLPFLLVGGSSLQFVVNRTVLRAGPDALDVKWGPVGSGSRRLSVPTHVWTNAAAKRGILLARAPDKQEVVARQLPALAALVAEHELARHYGLAAPRSTETMLAAERKTRRLVAAPLGFSIVFVAAGIYGLFVPLFGEHVVAELDLLGRSSHEVRFREAEELEVWLHFGVSFDEVLGNAGRHYIERLPREVAIEIQANADSVRCDPFDVEHFESQTTTTGVTETSVSWFGRLGCRLPVQPGEADVDAQLVRLGDTLRVDDARVLLRAPPD